MITTNNNTRATHTDECNNINASNQIKDLYSKKKSPLLTNTAFHIQNVIINYRKKKISYYENQN